MQRKWLEMENVSDVTKQRYINKIAKIVVAVLQTVSPENAVHLCQALCSTTIISKLLNTDELTNADHLYLKALSEAYKLASSWSTRRQVLSIMTGLASFNTIKLYITYQRN